LEITVESQELPRPRVVVITTKEQREESRKVNSPSTVAFRRAKGSNVCPERERYFREAIRDYRTLLFSFVTIITLHCGQSQATENKPPNIVLIFVDDLGWQETGFSGSDFLETPRLDQLAGEGMVFRYAYASAGNCQPSRACMLSGQYTARHGVYAVGSTDRGPKAQMRMIPVPNRANLPPETVTLGESLKAAGYATGFFGKCHMNASKTGKSEHAGFDVIAHSQHGLNSDDPADPKAIFSITKAACEFIEANRQRPFFAYIPHYAVHSRLEGRAETLARFKDKSPGKLGHDHTLLAGCLSDMDAGIGMVLDKLKSLGLEENTLVVFTSDNGGPHVTNEPLRGAKGGYYEGGIRVPMIVRWPGIVAAGSNCDTPVSNVDFYPTFLAASGAAAPASPLDGESLLPLFRAEGSMNRQSLFWHFPGYLDKPVRRGRDSVFRTRPVSVVRKGDWKLHLYHEEWQLDGGREKLASNRAVELYDLAADPGEHHDVAAIRTQQRDELLDELLVWMTQTQAVLPQNANPAYGPQAAGKNGQPVPVAQTWQEAAAVHAQILSRVKWTPVADTLPNRMGGFFEKGTEYTGVPYSSVRSEGRYIGFDIALRTFLAAVENPDSVLYTENLTGKVSNAAAYYGSVCSAYTSYALGCGFPEVSRRYGPPVGTGIVIVEPQSAESAQVGDVIYTPHTTETSGSHVEMVTAVTRDETGRVVSVRVEESRPPTTANTQRSAASFNAHLAARNKQLLRITDRQAWRGDNRAEPLHFPNPELDAKPPVINRALLLDLGDWVPYQKGSRVKFNVMDRDQRGVNTLVIQRSGEVVEAVALDGPGLHERSFDTCGDYTAHVIHADGSPSQACEFAVCDLDLCLPSESISMSQQWQVGFTAENINVIAVYLWNSSDSYGRHPIFLTDEQRKAGSITIPADLLKKTGTLQVWLIGEHPFGRLKLRKDIRLVP